MANVTDAAIASTAKREEGRVKMSLCFGGGGRRRGFVPPSLAHDRRITIDGSQRSDRMAQAGEKNSGPGPGCGLGRGNAQHANRPWVGFQYGQRAGPCERARERDGL